MAIDLVSICYQKGLEMAEAGKYHEAFAYMQEHLRKFPQDAQALNDAGTVLHCLGRSGEAIQYFLRARIIRPDSPEIVWNLVESYLAVGMPIEVTQLFGDMERMGILNVDVFNRTANICLEQGYPGDAIEILLTSLNLWPEQQKVLQPMIDIIRSKRPKISFVNGLKGDVKFLQDIYDFTNHRFSTQFTDFENITDLYELMKTSDICWFEWCTDVVAEASKLPKVCRNIVRLHRFEAYNNWPSRVRWENIDVLILVGNSYVKDALLKQAPDIENRTKIITIPNGINLDRYKFTQRQKGKNIACIGYLNMRKNPMFLLQCMQKLHYLDSQYKLFFGGFFQDAMLEQYIRYMIKAMGLEDVIFFDGWQSDISSWLADKHYIVSSSIGESQGMGVLEGMACGLKPVIHNFPGADQIFPSEFLFNISEDFCRQITSDAYEPNKYRNFVEETYPLKKQLKNINEIFTDLEKQAANQKDVSVKPEIMPFSADRSGNHAFGEVLFNGEKFA